MEETSSRPGMLDLFNRILKELLRTPKFKAQVKVVLNSLDPPAAAALVRTLMWEDTEIFLDMVGVFPELLNALLTGGREFTERMDQYPAPLPAAFIAQIIDKLDGEALGSLIAAIPELFSRLKEVPGKPLQQSLAGLGRRVIRGLGTEESSPAAAALAVLQPFLQQQIRRLAVEVGQDGSETRKLIQGLSQTLAAALQENPDFISFVCRPFLDSFRQSAGDGAS
ncbi:MAG: hypothetical protein AB1767_05550 [Bacillota bacterium]